MRIGFELHEGNVEDLPTRYQEVSCHIIVYVKMGYNLRRKSRMVSGGHKNTISYSITYSAVISRDSERTALNIAALNYLNVIACDIQTAYFTVKF